jgi:hypothetical protein
VHSEGCPTRREPGEGHPFTNGDLASTGSRLSGEILIPDEGWIPDHRIERSVGVNGEEVRKLNVGSAPDISDPLARHVCAMGMYFYAMDEGQRLAMGGEFAEALDRRY